MNKFIFGDLHDRLKNIPDQFANIIIIDPPYEKTALKWDKQFDIKSILRECNRIITNDGVYLIFGQEPQLSYWRVWSISDYRYDLIWNKSRKNGYVVCKNKPLCETEKIAVFSKANASTTATERMAYYPQCLRRVKKYKTSKSRPRHFVSGCNGGNTILQENADYPTDIIQVSSMGKPAHECEKPIELAEYLILSYSKLNDIIIDPAFGSGAFLHAAMNLNRRFIGIENDKHWFDYGRQRLQDATATKTTKEAQVF